ncbi:fasciclin-like arabinogalactan protein 19 [Forsythia ovata]|uniref:Fasciclin-like arabinogalactan protein 19 n=1 Tax=Forsythia ovata TaxID=205694 RepID=A0ABD1U7F9_9LAMI
MMTLTALHLLPSSAPRTPNSLTSIWLLTPMFMSAHSGTTSSSTVASFLSSCRTSPYRYLISSSPHYSVLIGKTQNDSVASNNGTTGVRVDGGRVSYPDIFVGSRIVVHGIDDVFVTGLNKYFEDLDESDKNGLCVTTNPAAALGNSPREFLAPMAQFDWNIAVSPPKGNLAPISQFE